MAREVQYLDTPLGPQPHSLPPRSPASTGSRRPAPCGSTSRVLIRAEAVGLGPAVDLRDHHLVVLDVVALVWLAAREPQSGMHLLEGAVAAAAVHVGVADDDSSISSRESPTPSR